MNIRVKPPMRLAIGELMLDRKPRTAKEVYNILAPRYCGEKQVCLSNIEGHLQALRAVGILALPQNNNGQDARDDTLYVISADGARRVQRSLVASLA